MMTVFAAVVGLTTCSSRATSEPSTLVSTPVPAISSTVGTAQSGKKTASALSTAKKVTPKPTQPTKETMQQTDTVIHTETIVS